MQKFMKFEKVLLKIENAIVVFAFAILFITVNIQVFQRYFNLPIIDTSEVSLTCQAVFTFICLGMLVHFRGHITIEITKLIKNKNILFIVDHAMYLVLLIFAGIFIWLSCSLMQFAFESGTATTALRIPLWIPYGAMLIGLILMVVHITSEVWKMHYYRRHPNEYVESETAIEDMR